MIVYSEKMVSKRDVRIYFSAKEIESNLSKTSIPELSQQQIMLAEQRLIQQKKRLKDKSTKINQRKSGRKLGDML